MIKREEELETKESPLVVVDEWCTCQGSIQPKKINARILTTRTKLVRWTVVRRVPGGSTGVHQGACWYVRRTFKEKDEVTVRRRGTAKERKRERRELKDGGSCSSKRKETEG